MIYLVTTAQAVQQAGCRFVFSDGHGLARFTHWYDDLTRLDEVDWAIVGKRYWLDQPDDNDRQRRKQAEFLVWQALGWSLIRGIAVLDNTMWQRVETILDQFPQRTHPKVSPKPDWYY